MSLFRGYEETVSVYHPDDVNATKKTSYPATADFTMKINIQKRGDEDSAILGDIYGAYYGHSDDTNAGNVQKGDKMVGTDTYYVSDEPRYIKLLQRYRFVLKK